MRQLVEQFAADSGVEFLPKAGRRHEGLQVGIMDPLAFAASVALVLASSMAASRRACDSLLYHECFMECRWSGGACVLDRLWSLQRSEAPTGQLNWEV